MNKKKYLADRKKLLDEAQALINEGNLGEEYTNKLDEIKKLDDSFEAACKAQANLDAMHDNTKITNIVGLNAKIEGGKVVETFENVVLENNEDIYASVEYRKAFMNNVIKGAAIPSKFVNVDANTTTGDVGSVIPTTVLEKIVEKLETTGMILPLITRTNYKGGVKIPTSAVKPIATWVSEGAGSDKQKKTTSYIDFGYNKLRCAVSSSLEVDTMALGVFETTFINDVVESMTKALEQAIITGTGDGQPKGILTETVADGQNVDIAAASGLTYDTLINAEAALPLSYESGAVWCMTKKTFMGFIGLVDSQKQPIARVNYGINGKPERTLLGRPVILNDYMSNYAATVTSDTVVAFLFNFKDYVLNTNYSMTVKRYEDNDTDDLITKAVMLVDGKVIDANSLVTVTKKA